MQELQTARDAALAEGAQRADDMEAVREAAAAKEAELSGLVSQLQQDLAGVQAERQAKETERLGLQAQVERLTKELVRPQDPRQTLQPDPAVGNDTCASFTNATCRRTRPNACRSLRHSLLQLLPPCLLVRPP